MEGIIRPTGIFFFRNILGYFTWRVWGSWNILEIFSPLFILILSFIFSLLLSCFFPLLVFSLLLSCFFPLLVVSLLLSFISSCLLSSLVFYLLFSCLVLSCLSSFIFSCLLVLSRLLLSLFLCLSVCLLSLSLSACLRVLLCVVSCGVCRCGRGMCLVCVCCGTLEKRGKNKCVWIQKRPTMVSCFCKLPLQIFYRLSWLVTDTATFEMDCVGTNRAQLPCKSGKRRKTSAKCAVHKDEKCFLLGPDLSSRSLCEERNVTVMSTVTGCDVPTVQQRYKSSTSSFHDSNRWLLLGTLCWFNLAPFA